MLESCPVLRLAVAALLLAALGLAALGCSSHVRHPPYVGQPTSALVEVDWPPPPARVELVPAVPSSEAVYVDGEWMWRRGRWAWLPGRWVVPPAGRVFSPWVFVRGPEGRLWYAPGAWRDLWGMAVNPPDPVAIASVETGVVVTAEGASEITGPSVRARPRPAASAASSAK